MKIECPECGGAKLIYNPMWCCERCSGPEEYECENCDGTGEVEQKEPSFAI